MIRVAAIGLSLWANATVAQGLSAARLLESCGGMRVVVAPQDAMDETTLDDAQSVISALMQDQFVGLLDYTSVEDGQIIVSVPGEGEDVVDVVAMQLAPFDLSFHDVVSRGAQDSMTAGGGEIVAPSQGEDDIGYLLDANAILGAADFVDARPVLDSNSQPAVSFRFSRDAGRIFGDYTGAHIGEPFAIVLNGDVVSAPIIREQISGGAGIITGAFTVEATQDLAVMMRGGPLPSGLVVVSQTRVDGADPSADFCP